VAQIKDLNPGRTFGNSCCLQRFAVSRKEKGNGNEATLLIIKLGDLEYIYLRSLHISSYKVL